MELKSYPMSIGKAVCQEPGSRWKNLLHFWIPVGMFQYFTFSPEVNADALLKLDRKIPDLMLLGK